MHRFLSIDCYYFGFVTSVVSLCYWPRSKLMVLPTVTVCNLQLCRYELALKALVNSEVTFDRGITFAKWGIPAILVITWKDENTSK